jgi:hypothetical protein
MEHLDMPSFHADQQQRFSEAAAILLNAGVMAAKANDYQSPAARKIWIRHWRYKQKSARNLVTK